MMQTRSPTKMIYTRNCLELMLKKTIHMVYPNLFALFVYLVFEKNGPAYKGNLTKIAYNIFLH